MATPLSSEARAALAEIPPQWTDPEAIASLTVGEVRELVGLSGGEVEPAPLPAGVEGERIAIHGPGGALAGRLYRPAAGARPGTALWVRGGGFCILGHLDQDVVSPRLALESGRTVVTFEYRLSPEHPFPAAVEDCFAALLWTAENAATIGGGSDRVVLGGDSAGGNLTAALTLLARDRGGPPISLQALLYPMTARRFDGPSRHDPAVGALAHPDLIEWLWRHYLVDGGDADPLASPLDAESLAALPPALILTAEYDVLRDEGEAYAARLAAAGVPVTARRYEGVFHGFVEWLDAIPAAAECVGEIGRAFSQALGPR